MAQPKPSERSAELLLLVVVLIWALNAPLAKYGLGGLNVFVFNSLRFLVAFSVLLVIFLFRNTWIPVSRSDWFQIIGIGFLSNVVYQLFYIIGLKFTTAGNSAVLLSTSPLWTAFFNARIHKERIFGHQWFGMALSLVGIVMIIIGSGKKLEFGSDALYGDLLSLGAAMMWALFTNLLKPLLTRYSPMQVTVIGVGVGALGLTAVAIPASLSLEWSSVEPVFYVIPFVSGALSNGIAIVLWSYGVRSIGPSRASNFNNLVPVIAFVAAYFTLHEEVFLIQVIGAAVTVTGVWIARR
jgi:drug/metabolite transporter (DMT)-like permease